MSRQAVISELARHLLQELRIPGHQDRIIVGDLPKPTDQELDAARRDVLPILDRLLSDGYQGLDLLAMLHYLAFRRMIDPYQRSHSTAAAYVDRKTLEARTRAAAEMDRYFR